MREALIVWGGWEGHQPEKCAFIVEGILVEEGFVVAKAGETNVFADPDLARFDLDFHLRERAASRAADTRPDHRGATGRRR